jgi:hypothetical protein
VAKRMDGKASRFKEKMTGECGGIYAKVTKYLHFYHRVKIVIAKKLRFSHKINRST